MMDAEHREARWSPVLQVHIQQPFFQFSAVIQRKPVGEQIVD